MTTMQPTTTQPMAARHRERPVYTGVGAFGLLLVALAPALMLALAMATGQSGDETIFFLVVAGVPAVAAVLVWRFGTWAKVLGAVISILAALNMFWITFGLTFPASFGDFTPGVIFPLGVALGLGGCIAAILQGRRGNLRAAATTAERRLVLGSLALVFLAAVLSAGLWLTSRTTIYTGSAATTATMADFAFADSSYELSGGESLVVHNADGFVHDFTVSELGIATTVLPGQDALITVPNQPGTYTVHCTLHSSAEATDASGGDMVTTLVVK